MPRMGDCEWCCEPTVNLSRHPNARFCSKRCFGLWRWKNKPETLNGLVPGSNPFNKGKAPRGSNHYAWKGEEVSYRAALDRTRRLYPNPEPCNRCGTKPDIARIHRHHKDRDRLNNNPNNIEFLCTACHNTEHFH